jgi:isopenicillin N synthase-like dioxygenase
MIIYTPPKAATELPVIDLAPSFRGPAERQSVAREIHKACRDTGFFYVRNHGIPPELMAAQLDWTARLFALSPDAKQAMDFSQSKRRLGYEPPMRQVLDAGSAPDLKESYMYIAPLGGVGADAIPNLWPTDLAGFKTQMLAYHRAIGALGMHVIRCLALSLDLDENFFDEPFRDTEFSVRILRYPPQNDLGGNRLGAGAHTDWGGITLLLQDSLGGLEVLNRDRDWISATPIENTFVINLGDMVRRWTNDVYHSTMHRVLNTARARDRYSVAAFFSPRPDTIVSCVPTCLQDRPSLYAPITARDHIAEMVRKTYGH